MAKVTHRDIREGIVDTCRAMNRSGLNQGTSGNLSHRLPDGMLITPTSLAYERMGPKDIVEMSFDGTFEGRRRPSSEWRFHRDILKNRPDVTVVLHTHSTYATTLAVHERGIPAFHYMVAVAGGTDVRCAPYACFGTQALSDHALKALDGRLACLLGHHGLIVLADTFEKALWRAVEIETLAKMYVHALAIGEPRTLADDEMARVLEQFRRMSYGDAPDLDPVKDAPRARPATALVEAAKAKEGKKERRVAVAAEAVRRPVAALTLPVGAPAKPKGSDKGAAARAGVGAASSPGPSSPEPSSSRPSSSRPSSSKPSTRKASSPAAPAGKAAGAKARPRATSPGTTVPAKPTPGTVAAAGKGPSGSRGRPRAGAPKGSRRRPRG